MKTKLHATIVLAAIVSICSLSTTAWAGLAPPPHAPLPTCEGEPEEEASFPDPVVLELHNLSRGVDDNTSKAGVGFLSVLVDGFDGELVDGADSHDHEGVENATYGLRIDVEGQAPEKLAFPEDPVVLLDPHDRIHLHWDDMDTRDEAIDLTVTATWIDCYGRTGESSDPLNIVDDGDGSTISGCSTTGGGGTPAMLLLALAMVVGFRGRRWRGVTTP